MFEKVTVEEFIDEVSMAEIMAEFEEQRQQQLEMWLDELDFAISFDF